MATAEAANLWSNPLTQAKSMIDLNRKGMIKNLDSFKLPTNKNNLLEMIQNKAKKDIENQTLSQYMKQRINEFQINEEDNDKLPERLRTNLFDNESISDLENNKFTTIINQLTKSREPHSLEKLARMARDSKNSNPDQDNSGSQGAPQQAKKIFALANFGKVSNPETPQKCNPFALTFSSQAQKPQCNILELLKSKAEGAAKMATQQAPPKNIFSQLSQENTLREKIQSLQKPPVAECNEVIHDENEEKAEDEDPGDPGFPVELQIENPPPLMELTKRYPNWDLLTICLFAEMGKPVDVFRKKTK